MGSVALSDTQLGTLREELDKLYARTLEELRLKVADSEQWREFSDRVPADAGDRSVADELADLNVSIADRELGVLRMIEAARDRMRAGDYGICVDCGVDIPFERLVAYPIAERCIADQERWEKTHARPPTPTL